MAAPWGGNVEGRGVQVGGAVLEGHSSVLEYCLTRHGSGEED